MTMHKINIETPRLRLRNFEIKDSQFLIELWTSEVNTKFMGGPRSIELMEDNVKEYIDEPFKDKYDLWIVEEVNTLKPVGHCGFIEKEVDGINEIEIIYVIENHFKGKGYATEISKALIEYGFNHLHLAKIVALIKPENEISKKVAVKLGMDCEREIVRNHKKMYLYSVSKEV